MSSPPPARPNQTRHLTALAAGVVALVAFFALPPGLPGYLGSIAVGIIAVAIGHSAIRLRGSLRWAAIVGLVLSYYELVTAIGLLLARLTSVFTR